LPILNIKASMFWVGKRTMFPITIYKQTNLYNLIHLITTRPKSPNSSLNELNHICFNESILSSF